MTKTRRIKKPKGLKEHPLSSEEETKQLRTNKHQRNKHNWNGGSIYNSLCKRTTMEPLLLKNFPNLVKMATTKYGIKESNIQIFQISMCCTNQ